MRTAYRKEKPVVLVLGGTGFVGRYAVRALEKAGASVIIGTRGLPENKKGRIGRYTGPRADHSHIEKRTVNFLEGSDLRYWNHVLGGVDVVINCVGILRQGRGASLSLIQHQAVATLARACERKRLPLIHMSALGITKVSNPNTYSKLMGEQSILNSGASAFIVRASVVDAFDGYGSGWFRRLAEWPVWPLPEKADKLMSPVAAVDLGEALALLAIDAWHELPTKVQIVEVGCGEWFTLETYLNRLRKKSRYWPFNPLIIRVPQSMARFIAHCCDRFNLTPYSVAHHELLEHHSVPGVNHLPEILNREPTMIGAAQALDTDMVRLAPVGEQ